MSFNLYFKDAATMTKILESHESLTKPLYVETRVTEAVIILAIKRFANTWALEVGIELETELILEDLKVNQDRFTGAILPPISNLKILSLPRLAEDIMTALIACTNKRN